MQNRFSGLILASSSRYRSSLLKTLGIAFTTGDPSIDETPKAGESARALSLRLAREKANKIAKKNPGALVIGSDQVALFDNKIIGKPGSKKAAIKQLSILQGQKVDFFTSVALCSKSLKPKSKCANSVVSFRTLSKTEIERYIEIDHPIDCAGSFKSESLGISLFNKIKSDDPTALIGLPLISLTSLFIEFGINPIDLHEQFLPK